MKPALVLTSLIMLFTLTASGTTIHVPADQPTIQAGIHAASESDTILVAPGNYTGDGNRDLVFNGKDVVLISQNGPEVTIIDCEGSTSSPHRGFAFASGETSACVVKGFTIKNGYSQSDGGGIYCATNSRPTITGNIIANNAAWTMGAGIYCYYANPVIEGNSIRDNRCVGNTFSDGGGIACRRSSPTIDSNTISGNIGTLGGGIYCVEGSNPTISHNVISDNMGELNGGGIHCGDDSDPAIVQNEITGNWSGFGGGINCVVDCDPLISQNLIFRNDAVVSGGGICCWQNCNPTAISNTIVRNAPSGLHSGYSQPIIEHCIIAYTLGGSGVECEGYGVPELRYCNLYANDGGDWVDCIADQLDVRGNFSADPLFCDADINDFFLWAASPCAPAASPDGWLVGCFAVGCAECGDANADGTISVDDISSLKAFYFNGASLPVPSAADLDCDGQIRLNDIILLAGYYYGYGPETCCAPPPKRQDQPEREEITGQ